MSVTVKTSGPRQKIDLKAMAKVFEASVPGLILRRVAEGRDILDRPFAPYSGAYNVALGEAGEDLRVDLRLTSGLLNSVKLRQTVTTATGVRLIFGPDGGTSPTVSLQDGRAKRTGKRGPPHNVVGYWLHYGTPHMRARPWLALSPRDRRVIQGLLKRRG